MEEMNTIGTLLKSTREKKNISIEEIARQTKININVLRSLEQDDIKNLPNKTYVKGFVKNYAKAISLDINDAKNALENTYEIKLGGNVSTASPEKKLGALQADNPEQAETEELKETFNSIIQSILNKKVIYAVAGVIVIVLILKGVISFFSNLNFESKKMTETPTEIEAPTEKADAPLKAADENLFDLKATKKLAEENSSKQEVKEVAEPKKVETKKEIVKPVEVTKKDSEDKPEEGKKKTEEKKKEVPKLVDGKFPYKEFRTASTKLYSLNATAEEVSQAELLPPSIKNSMVEGKQNVFIVAKDADTWISYKKDDEKIKRYILKKGRTVLLKGDRILLFMGNFNATKVFLNNQLVEAQTRTGVKSLIFPQEVANEYELPLFPSFKGIPYSAAEYKANMVEKETTVTN